VRNRFSPEPALVEVDKRSLPPHERHFGLDGFLPVVIQWKCLEHRPGHAALNPLEQHNDNLPKKIGVGRSAGFDCQPDRRSRMVRVFADV